MEDRVQKLEENFETLSRSQKELFSQVAEQLERHNQQISGKQTIEIGETSANNGCRFRTPNSRVESDKVSLASYYLEGDSQLWFQMLEQEQLYVTWEDFKNGLQTRFGPNQFVDPFGELIQLRQTGTVVEYQARFEKLLAKVGSLAPDKKVSCFVTGLKDSIRTDVQANLPSTLTMAIGLARLFEARDTTHRQPTTVTSSRDNNNWR
ncbi:hypothetical protein LWI29_019561 [Acer saccharum]|uniref:Retrotransposon gag domain-containing protein n=1 Tax=Acer saccharum TaxID=4024 RepID=A0AA39RYX4_ACESA|nr:hypothetical protein LWI29_019561 [Acer saccharum]